MYKLSIKGEEASEKICRKPSHVKIFIYDEFDALTQTGNCIFEIDTSIKGKDNNILEAEWDKEVDFINSKLPTANFSFKFLDVDKKYNPDVNDGAWQEIEKQLPCCFYFGYTLEDDSIEWVKCGTYITTGENEWDLSEFIPVITIHTKSIIYFLTDEIDISTINRATYYEFLNDLRNCLKSSNEIIKNEWVKIVIPEEFESYNIAKTFAEGSDYVANQLFQLIAQASERFLNVDRDGNIIFAFIPTENTNFYLNYEKISKPPSLTRYPYLKKINLSYSKPVPDKNNGLNTQLTLISTTANINEQNLSIASNQLYMYMHRSYSPTIVEIDVGEFAEITFYNSFKGATTYYAIFNWEDYETKTSEIKITEYPAYLLTATFKRTGETTFEIIFNTNESYWQDFFLHVSKIGWGSETTEAIATFDSKTAGDKCSIENVFVSSEKQAKKIIEYLTEIIKCRNEYSGIENRGYPELDVGDIIMAETAYSNSLPVYLLSNKVKYDGALSGECKYLLLQK